MTGKQSKPSTSAADRERLTGQHLVVPTTGDKTMAALRRASLKAALARAAEQIVATGANVSPAVDRTLKQ